MEMLIMYIMRYFPPYSCSSEDEYNVHIPLISHIDTKVTLCLGNSPARKLKVQNTVETPHVFY